jgi:hypothetical protein
MKKFLVLAVVAASLLFFSTHLYADEISDLKKEMQELQDRLVVLEAEDENQMHVIENFMEISGYGDGEYIMTDQKGKNNEFRVHHLSLFFIKQITEKWRMFSEIEYEDAPKVEEPDEIEGKIFVEVFTLEYYLNQYVNFRLGRFLTPAGIWNVDHYPPFVLTQERPMHIRKIFPQLNDGLQFLGSVNMAQTVTDYKLYVSNGQGNTGHGDGNEDKALGGRAKFALHFLDLDDWGFRAPEIGFSYYKEEKNDDEDFKAAGADLRLYWKDLTLQAEYAKGYGDPSFGSIYQRIGYYAQMAYNYKNWTLGYRYDWYDPDTTLDNDRKTINSLVLNYHFTPYVVGKLEYHWNDPQDSAIDNYTKTLLSIAVYLGN